MKAGLWFVIGLAVLRGGTAVASEDRWRGPLSSRNEFPPALLFLSLDPERARVLGKGERSFALDLAYSNVLSHHVLTEESLVLDMEHLHSTARFSFGVGRGLELEAAVPVHTMYGGFLDGFISGFHETFGFANQLRSRTPNGLFRYEYWDGHRPVLSRSEAGTSIGDLVFEVKKAFTGAKLGGNEIALRTAIKLPTGSLERLTGSGAADLGLGLLASRVGERFGGYVNLSYQILGDVGELAPASFLSLMAAFDYRFKPHLALVVQYDQFQEIFESAIRVLDQPGRQIAVGLRWRRSDRFHYEWRLAEDLSSTSPDFTFGFQLGMRFGRAR